MATKDQLERFAQKVRTLRAWLTRVRQRGDPPAIGRASEIEQQIDSLIREKRGRPMRRRPKLRAASKRSRN